jgi:nitrite reductase (NO-forming)/hydroxylamine reductase
MKTLHKTVFHLAVAGSMIFASCGGGGEEKKKEDEKTGEKKPVHSNGDISLTDDEMKQASDIYFQVCAGCHGTLRKGATGPSLLPDGDGKFPATKQLGTEGLKAFMVNGTPGGMPSFGKDGLMTDAEIELMAKFLQLEPPAIPPFTLDDMKANWKLTTPVEERPTKPEHTKNWQNFVGVILRDAGKVAIIDGDTKEKINIIETGYAVHILRSSASGRYFYSIGRDGKITLIDLWMETPGIVAEGKASFDARSVEVSKYKGFEDKYLIVGGYSPSHYAVFDAMTLEPLTVVKTSGKALETGEFLEEARVASIVASHQSPIWIVNIKETGMVWIVDYSDLSKIDENTIKIPSAQFLHDGGWDKSGRYFLVAANASNKIVVVDSKEKKLETIIETGTKPHPGRGANIKNSKFGNMWVTGHVGENKFSLIATDPGPNQWKIVAELQGSGNGGGNLFVKTHPKSKHLWADRPLSNEVSLQRSVDVFDIETLKLKKTITMPDKYVGRFVHMEYNKDGNEVWISVWGNKAKPEENALLIYDDKTLELKKEITGDWMVTPTGKFNVYNTMKDIY